MLHFHLTRHCWNWFHDRLRKRRMLTSKTTENWFNFWDWVIFWFSHLSNFRHEGHFRYQVIKPVGMCWRNGTSNCYFVLSQLIVLPFFNSKDGCFPHLLHHTNRIPVKMTEVMYLRWSLIKFLCKNKKCWIVFIMANKISQIADIASKEEKALQTKKAHNLIHSHTNWN